MWHDGDSRCSMTQPTWGFHRDSLFLVSWPPGFVQVTLAALTLLGTLVALALQFPCVREWGGVRLMVIQVPVTFSKLPVKQRKAALLRWGLGSGRENLWICLHTFTLPTPFSHSLIIHRGLQCCKCHTNTRLLRDKFKSRWCVHRIVHLLHEKSKKFWEYWFTTN